AKINDEPLQAELRKQEAQLKLFQDRMYRQNALLEKEAVSEEAFQEAQANLAALHAEIDRVKANIAQKELRAPFDGVLGLREVSLGAYVSPTTPIVKLTKMNPLKIEFSVPERYSGVLKAGSRLNFTVEGDLAERSAKVYATDSRVNMDTRTFTVRALYDNSDGALFPGRYVNVNLLTREYPDAIAVPSEAIVSEMGHDKVFLYKGGKAVTTIITKGIRNEELVQVVQGLAVGDTVITTGTMQLREGQSVVLDGIKRIE
ncbi:MAG: efflux RND transporter periplasmic adaptor subunit, partial [Alistipes sp.]|nr:efflux RND transporter periplasmic adaptor subunit [Alistipes sp.]